MMSTKPACSQHDNCRADKPNAVRLWMFEHQDDYRERLTNEPQYTQLAEAAAYAFDHNEWLDDEQHDVWDWSIDVLDGWQPNGRFRKPPHVARSA